jgi:magnesium-transporting ATPase (P-type)
VVAARGAGIRVVMIMGDYLLTAIAIAKNVARWQGRGVVKLDEAGNQLVEFD